MVGCWVTLWEVLGYMVGNGGLHGRVLGYKVEGVGLHGRVFGCMVGIVC